MYEHLDLDAHVIEDAQITDTLNELVLLERIGRTSDDVNLQPTPHGSHKSFDNDGILVALVLNEQEMMGASVRQRTGFARIPLDILAGSEPSVRGEDMNSLVD